MYGKELRDAIKKKTWRSGNDNGSNKSTFGFGHAHKAVGLTLDVIYVVKVTQKTLKKVTFFLTKWEMVERPVFLSILTVKSYRFLTCYSGAFHEISLIWARFESK